jgi:hypothetical protein
LGFNVPEVLHEELFPASGGAVVETAASSLTAVVETAASLITALGPSKIYISKNHQTLKKPDTENIARC